MSQGKLFDDFLPDDQQETLDDYRDAFDSSKVVLYSTDWTVGSVIQQIQKKRIDLNPSFQRRQAWDVSHRSRFIESLILNIPIPQIVLAEDPARRGFYIVIDGKQRLLSLAQFVQNQENSHIELANTERFTPFKLSGLMRGGEEVSKLNGRFFHDLPNDVQAQIDNTVLRTVIIRSVENVQFLYEAFLRLNQGSKSLSPQELRQALAPGAFTDWLDTFSCQSKPLQKALRIKKPDPRMRDSEIALRFMAFRDSLDGYDGNFKSFLDSYMVKKNKDPFNDVLGIELERALETTLEIFGDHAFEKFDPKIGAFTGKFNRAVFDSMTFFFANEEISQISLKKRDDVLEAFKDLCKTSSDYVSAVETSFKNVKETASRLQLWGEKLSKVIDHSLPVITIEKNKIRVQK